jgi:antitoxin component YwqK of YwqJK toxin-antitoxin module
MKKYILWSIFLLIIGCEKKMKDGVNIVEFYEDGQKKVEKTFKNQVEDGLHTEYYENGQKKEEGNYYLAGKGEKEMSVDEINKIVDGYQSRNDWKRKIKKFGLHTVYYENGQKKEEGHWKSDNKRFYTQYYKNGQKKEEKNKFGFTTTYYENGQKKEEGDYHSEHGKYGLWTTWYENGQIKEEGKYDVKFDRTRAIPKKVYNGKHGLWTTWYENGKIKQQGNWDYLGEFIGFKWDENGKKKNSMILKERKENLGKGKNECPCCGRRFDHSGYRMGIQNVVRPGAYDSESCAITCEKVNGLMK